MDPENSEERTLLHIQGRCLAFAADMSHAE
jgi:hypothetical protein